MDESRQRARVLVVDDDEATRDVIRAALVAAGYHVRAEPGGTAVEKVFARFAPHLVILEVRHGDGPDPYTILRSLRRTRDVPVVLISSEDSPEARLAGFQEGADDYVSKPLPVPEVVARVGAVLRRSRRRSSEDVEIGDLRMTEDLAPVVSMAGKLVRLSPTEYEVLSVLARHGGEVVPKSQLIQEVWGSQALNAEIVNLLAVHVSALRRKLGLRGGHLLHAGRGYVLAVPSPGSTGDISPEAPEAQDRPPAEVGGAARDVIAKREPPAPLPVAEGKGVQPEL